MVPTVQMYIPQFGKVCSVNEADAHEWIAKGALYEHQLIDGSVPPVVSPVVPPVDATTSNDVPATTSDDTAETAGETDADAGDATGQDGETSGSAENPPAARPRRRAANAPTE
jgi:hypothetical protein